MHIYMTDSLLQLIKHLCHFQVAPVRSSMQRRIAVVVVRVHKCCAIDWIVNVSEHRTHCIDVSILS